MTNTETTELALSLMKKYNLLDKGWCFKLDNAKRRFGRCNYSKKLISISSPLAKINGFKNVNDTILHEIAHALVGRGHGHDRAWKQKAIEIGCNGERCFDSNEVNMPQGKYTLICTNCGKKHTDTEKQIKIMLVKNAVKNTITENIQRTLN